MGITLPIHADVLDIPAPSDTTEAQTADTTSFTLPGRGMNKEQVESRFGVPSEKVLAVGEPPISRWVYGNFTVYFEDDVVLHAVLHKQ